MIEIEVGPMPAAWTSSEMCANPQRDPRDPAKLCSSLQRHPRDTKPLTIAGQDSSGIMQASPVQAATTYDALHIHALPHASSAAVADGGLHWLVPCYVRVRYAMSTVVPPSLMVDSCSTAFQDIVVL